MLSTVLDLSHHQPWVDFRRVRAAGVVGIIHKASEGAGYQDDALARRRDLCASVGLLFGAYHFGTGADPVRQAQRFLGMVRPGDLLALDVERNPSGTSMSLAQAETFAEAVWQAARVRVVVYGGGDYLRDVLRPPASSPLGRGGLWWSRWGDVPPTSLPAPWKTWSLWQHTNGEVGAEPRACDGVGRDGRCDRSVFNGDEAALRAFWSAHALAG